MDTLPSFHMRGHGLAVVVDFDNTLTTADIGDLVADAFAGPAWREVDERFLRGELTLRELLTFMFGTMKTSPEQLAAFARGNASLRKYAREFLAAAKEIGLPVVLASGGLEVYIRAILGPAADDVILVCNRARFRDDGSIDVVFPEWTRGCGACGNCKASVVEALRAAGARTVAAIGDGNSDRCMARTADLVIARDKLFSWTKELQPAREVVPFEDFADVVRALSQHAPELQLAFAVLCEKSHV